MAISRQPKSVLKIPNTTLDISYLPYSNEIVYNGKIYGTIIDGVLEQKRWRSTPSLGTSWVLPILHYFCPIILTYHGQNQWYSIRTNTALAIGRRPLSNKYIIMIPANAMEISNDKPSKHTKLPIS